MPSITSHGRATLSSSVPSFSLVALQRLQLAHFRNYGSLDITLSPKPVVIWGKNGTGKTNLLEAISLLAPGKGLRSAAPQELAMCGGDADGQEAGGMISQFAWSVYAELQQEEVPGHTMLGTGRLQGTSEQSGRVVHINGEKQQGQQSLLEYVGVCFLTPQMSHLLSEGATARRRWLDKIVAQFFPTHARHLAVYEKVKGERLKLLMRGVRDETWLDSLEQRMAAESMAIADARLQVLVHMQQAMTQIVEEGFPFPSAVLSIRGAEEFLVDQAALEAETALQRLLGESRVADAEAGRTHHGAHVSDFVVVHAQKQKESSLCSTGEQKALMLMLTLAASYARAHWTGKAPLLLLDEIAAHLDAERRQALFQLLPRLHMQYWLTTTEQAHYDSLEDDVQTLHLKEEGVVVCER